VRRLGHRAETDRAIGPNPGTLAGVELDHALIAVADLATAASEIEARYGLASIEGGCHPGWGTANRIVPLGDTYLELVAVVDEAEAVRSDFGRWVATAGADLLRPLGWAVRTRRLDEVAGRLGLTPVGGSRVSAGGRALRWRTAGIERAAAEPSLPFFIEWGLGTPFPGRAAGHPTSPLTIARLEVDGDAGRLAEWLDGRALPVVVRPGAPSLAGIVLSGPAGEVVLGG
jgi:hypothetical protein